MGIYTEKADATRRLSRNVSQSKSSIEFFVMVKPVDDNVYKVLVDCTTKRKRELRMHSWLEQNYQEQAPRHSGTIESMPGAKYVLKLNGNFKAVSGSSTASLIFYPKEDNYIIFEVTVLSPSTAFVNVFGVKTTLTQNEIEEKLICLPIELTGIPVARAQVPIHVQAFSGFTSNSFLRLICTHLEDEWTTLAILLGMDVRTVEIYRTNVNLSDSDKKFRTLEVWRDTCKQKKDFGVNQIALAVRIIGREDLLEIIQNEIETWLEANKDQQHNFIDFYHWAKINRIGLTLAITDTEDPMPVSDQFLMLLINKFPFGKCGTINDIGLQMGLSKTDREKILKDVINTNPEYRLLRVHKNDCGSKRKDRWHSKDICRINEIAGGAEAGCCHEGELKLKVEVWDVDDNNNDHVDFLSGVFGLKAARSQLEAPVAAFQIRKRTLLTYNVKVYCDEYYFGEYCDIFCKPSDGDFGHYTCDSTTGMQICDPGWSGQFCDESNIDECRTSPCNGTQKCINTLSGYECICPDGFTGIIT
ncbi:uncharacterized protein LOC143056410 [Mytilus galloprovincialis]|uniref:uncharacterized protein LOC143056410 n=1 Tax=Mytilus galloprovincialis TaxID=29158 RepID=UPI003F7BA097